MGLYFVKSGDPTFCFTTFMPTIFAPFLGIQKLTNSKNYNFSVHK